MSSNKKSLGSVLLLLFVFLAIAGASWLYFSKNQTQPTVEGANVEQQQSDDASANGANGSGNASKEDHSGHNHGNNTAPIGQKGIVQELPVNAVLGRRGVGDPNAPVKIQEFFSLTCNHCASFHANVYPALKEKYVDTGKVYFVFEEFPLNGPALYGSMISRCLPSERYAGFVSLLLKNQKAWAFGGDFKASLKQNALLAGMSDEAFDTCFENKELQKAIGINIKAASDLWKISSTPTFVLNDGELILRGSQTLENLETAINNLIDGKPLTASVSPASKAVTE